ncbi:hypothetical protein EG329_011268 [Mollisiaceae sp. DMI_Dod_QoI]|nr:hypothetical protein EG329_011268 [Helotiales sp. DMI_Dod_QoI]
MTPEQIPIGAYTHLNFAFAFINPSTYQVAPMAENQVNLYKRVTALKQSNPGMEVWISVGGWSMNDPDQPTASTFSNLAGSTANQNLFFRSLVSFMETYGFDGVDMDWEYPGAEERSGKASDFDNYTKFLGNLRTALGSSGHRYGLSITIPTSYWYMRHFDIVGLSKVIDWFNLMSYDLHGTWDSTNKYIGSVVGSHTNLTEIDAALELLWRNNINPSQVVLGLGLYGRSFTLTSPSCNQPGCPFSSGGKSGPCTQNVGTLSYAEILRVIANGATISFHQDAAVKQAVWNNNQWVSYDDAQTLGMKLDYANKHCLGGTMVWAVSQDNKNGSGATALSRGTAQLPGTGQLSKALGRTPPRLSPEGQCYITGCSKTPTCPSDWGAVQQMNGNRGNVSIGHGCGNKESRTFCCPSRDMPTCYWRGSATLCQKGCDAGDLELTYDTHGCNFNHKTLCCKKTVSDVVADKCVWVGSAPGCSDNTCPKNKPIEIARSNTGDNQQPCDFDAIHSRLKVFCCQDPSPYTGCVWYTKGDQDPPPSPRPYKCSGKCPVGKYLIATDDMCYGGGTRALCCDQPATYNDFQLTDFKNKLNSFETPLSCPSSETNPKRDLQHLAHEVQETKPINGTEESFKLSDVALSSLQQRDFAKAGGYDFISSMLVSLRATTYVATLYRQAFNNTVGDRNNFHVDDLLHYINFCQELGFDDTQGALSALCQGRLASATLADLRSNSHDLCRVTGPHLKGRDVLPKPNSTELNKRIFDLGNAAYDPPTLAYPRPFTGSLMRAIANRDPTIRYLYTRRIDYNYQYRGANIPQVILEVAYDLTNAPTLQERQGTDIFGVLHFHVDGLTPQMDHLAVRSIGVFHGQAITPVATTGDYRVYGRRTRIAGHAGGPNARTHILQCDYQEDEEEQIEGYLAPGDMFQGTIGTGSNQIWAMADELNWAGILIPGAIHLDVHGNLAQGGNPGGGRESANFGTNGGDPPVDLTTQGFPVVANDP